jgi:hypothetical protein
VDHPYLASGCGRPVARWLGVLYSARLSVGAGKVPVMEKSLALGELIKRQSYVVTRRQALEAGLL